MGWFIRFTGFFLTTLITAHFAEATDLNFATGRQGGSQYPVSVALSQIIEKIPGIGDVSLQPGGGSGNVIAVG